MTWRVSFSKQALKAFRKLDRHTQERITALIDERLSTDEDPRRTGKALTGKLAGLWRYRVGDYRLICEIRDGELVIFVLSVGHRRDIYE